MKKKSIIIILVIGMVLMCSFIVYQQIVNDRMRGTAFFMCEKRNEEIKFSNYMIHLFEDEGYNMEQFYNMSTVDCNEWFNIK